MRRFFISPTDITDCSGIITGTEAHHITQVLRLQARQDIELFDGTGLIYQATISSVSKSSVQVQITGNTKVAENIAKITLSQALIKGKKMDLVFQKATELGIHTTQPMITKYSIRKGTTDNQLERWRRIAFESCKQCGRPTLMNCKSSAAFNDIIKQAANFDTKFLFWEDESKTTLHDLKNMDWGGSILMLIGPEGGFSPAEVDLATSAGFKSVSLGKRILRAETAAISAMAIIQFLLDSPQASIQKR